MLKELRIGNLALIESLNLSFSANGAANSLIVLTGETGAGKSIILQAISLIAAGRTTASMVRTGAEAALAEALFEIDPADEKLLAEIRDSGFDCDGSLIIKRVLSSEGRSKYFINNSLATARMAGDLAENLLCVAGQHEHQLLLKVRSHLDVIDTVGSLWPERQLVASLFSRYHDLKAGLEKLQKQEQEKEQRLDLLSYQYHEIIKAGISPDEDELLAAERTILKEADNLTQLGQAAYQLLEDDVLAPLAQARKNLEQLAAIDQSAAALAGELADCNYQLQDQAARLLDYFHSIPNDPARLEEIDVRIDLLQRLKKKYGGPDKSLNGLLVFADNAKKEIELLDSMEQQLAGMKKELLAAEKELLARAAALSARRKKTARQLAAAMRAELKSLNFKEAEFAVKFADDSPDSSTKSDPGAVAAGICDNGYDRPEFLFSANPGEPVKPLADVASGGELSRLMLALKCLLARKDKVHTVIFDEVDAGIGGQAAESIARKIKELAGHHQVICITHLPQIAALADEHFLVSKSFSNKRTQTVIALLNQEQRLGEIARMLAGESVTEQTLAYARELLEKGMRS